MSAKMSGAGAQNDQVTAAETAVILDLVQRSRAVTGDAVELGCYRGDTSVLIAQALAGATRDAKSAESTSGAEQSAAGTEQDAAGAERDTGGAEKKLYIYDSFAGLPEKTAADRSGAGANFRPGELRVSRREVVEKLRQHHLQNVVVRKAWFQDLGAADLPERVAFAFIDGDFYESQKQGLKLMAPRMATGGTMVCHDYNNPELPGAARAVDEFLAGHPEWRLQVRGTLAILTRG